jgi:ligand-binding sensor domain-containing protein
MARIRAWMALACSLVGAPVCALDPARPLDLFFHQAWLTRDGLPQNSIEAILQTRDGYMWLATQEGLVRFDGARFEVFDRNTTAGIRTNHVTSLLEARDGTLWAGTLGGGLLRWQEGKVTAYSLAQGLSSDSVVALAEDGAGRIWIGTQDRGVDVLEDGRVRANAVPGLPSAQLRALVVDRDGALWAGTSKGLVRVKEGKVDVFTTRQGLGSDVITALARDAAGLWIGTTAGLSHYARQASRAGADAPVFTTLTRRDGLSHDLVRALHVDADGCVWIGTASGGLNRWYAGRLSAFGSAQGLTSDTVLAVYTGREGALWIGTDGGGLNRLREGKLTAFGSRQGLSNRDVYTVAGSRHGDLLAGSYLGDVDLLEGTRFRRLVAGRYIGTSRVRTLLEDRGGVLWVGTEEGLWRARGAEPVRVTTREGGEGVVRALAEDAGGTVWVGTDGAGLFRVEKDVLVPASAELHAAQVRDIHIDRLGRMWVGTYSGLALLTDGKLTKTFTTADGLPHDYVRSIHESPDGTLWLGTYGGGLSRYRDGRFVNYGVRQGLFSDVIYAILEDGAGDLWMSCNRGIFRVARKELEDVAAGRAQRVTSQPFDEADGMPTRECNGGNPGAWRTADGRMWFATLGGVVMVDPARMSVNPVPPPVVIDRVVADGVDLASPGQTFTVGEVHALSPRPLRLELHYAGLSFAAPEKVRYRYRLEGFDHDWVEAGGSRTAHYTGLPPRYYRFRVIASNNDGVWNEEGATWEFRLAPRLHETPWFLGGCGLLLVGAAFGLHRWRTLNLRRSEQRLQERIHDAVARIKVLSGLLPICAACKKIRDDQGYWEQIEVYIRDHSEAQFSHGLCPVCIRQMYPEYADAVLAGGPVEEN